MAAAAPGGGIGMEPELEKPPQPPRLEETSSDAGPPGAEDTPQNGGRAESAEEALLAAAAEDKAPPHLSSSSSQRRSGSSAAPEPGDVLGGLPPLPKPPEDLPVRRNFQIPRKSREKKGCSFPPFPSSPLFSSLFILLRRKALSTPHRPAACKPPRVWRSLAWLGLERLLGTSR